jgi:hypothetical protein
MNDLENKHLIDTIFNVFNTDDMIYDHNWLEDLDVLSEDVEI